MFNILNAAKIAKTNTQTHKLKQISKTTHTYKAKKKNFVYSLVSDTLTLNWLNWRVAKEQQTTTKKEHKTTQT